MGGEQLKVGREGVGHPSIATPETADVVSEAFGGTGQQRKTDDGGSPAQELVQHAVVRAFLADIERAGHAEHRGVHADVTLPAERSGDLGGGPLPVEPEPEVAVAAEELG